MTIGFERPIFILAALAAIPLFLFASRYFKSVFALDLPLGPPGGIAFKSPVNLKFLMKLLHALELTGIFLLFAAAAGPNLIYSRTVWLNRGADILFVLDISPSMAGIDMGGRNRFDAARTLLENFAEQRSQDAIGLVAVGNDAALLVPLTTDRQSLHARLDTLAIGELGDGTALGTGLALAALHINQSQAPRRAVILITDGENNAGTIHPETAAAMLSEMGVSFWVIGVGSGGIIPIDFVDPFTRIRHTGMYDSGFDPKVLESLALSGGGNWIHAASAEAFSAAFAQMDRSEMVIRRSTTVRQEEPLYAFFIITAGVLLWGVRLVRRNVLGALL